MFGQNYWGGGAMNPQMARRNMYGNMQGYPQMAQQDMQMQNPMTGTAVAQATGNYGWTNALADMLGAYYAQQQNSDGNDIKNVVRNMTKH